MIPVPLWVAIALIVLSGLIYLYELVIVKPRQRRERQQRKTEL